MPVSTPQQLLQFLELSQLLSPEHFDRVRQEFAKAPGDWKLEDAARSLIAQEFLTEWQYRRLLLGETSFWLGNYKLIDCIGQGGMGAVFKAEHSVMGRLVALKVLSKARLNHSNSLARFRREVRASARLDHPNIITAHDAGQMGDVHFLVMEYVEGRDL
ncbi:MAG: protein kinase, partial [Planctomycetales bacterium]